MRTVLKIYLSLSSGVLLTALVLVTVFKLTNRNPLAPTAPTAQQAAEISIDTATGDDIPRLTADEVGLVVRFAGAITDKTLIMANVQLHSESNDSHTVHYPNLVFQRSSDGKYYGRILAPSPARLYFNTPVTILIKGEKHIQRRFETELAFGQHVDLTSKVLLAGDIANPRQDGRIDQNDIDYIKERIFTTDSAADINYDGVVNAGDLSLILNAIDAKVDEE